MGCDSGTLRLSDLPKPANRATSTINRRPTIDASGYTPAHGRRRRC